jgi:hypothetical protein
VDLRHRHFVDPPRRSYKGEVWTVEPWIPCAAGRSGGEDEWWSQADVQWRIGVMESVVSGERDEKL